MATSLHPVSDAPRTHCTIDVAGLGLVREAVGAFVEELRVGLGPVVEERGAQPVDRGPVDAEVRVAPLVFVARVALPLVGDADAAGERDRLVDDEHLPVRAVVHGPEPEPAQRPEPAHEHAGRVHLVDHGCGPSGARPRRRAAPRTRTPACAACREPARELGADLAAPVDEREEVDGVLGFGDRVEHRREDLVTVAQDVDAVALGCGNADDAFERSAQSRRRGHSCRADTHAGSAAARTSDASLCGSEWATFSTSLGAGAPARTASSCAATAAPNSTTTDESSAHSSSATMPASGPYVSPNDELNRKNKPRPTVTAAHSSTDTDAPNASQDHAGWWRRGDALEQERRRTHHQRQRERPAHDRPDSRNGVIVEPVTDLLAERERDEREHASTPVVIASTHARPYFCSVGRSCSMP